MVKGIRLERVEGVRVAKVEPFLTALTQRPSKICIHQAMFCYSEKGKFNPADSPAEILPQATLEMKAENRYRPAYKYSVKELSSFY